MCHRHGRLAKFWTHPIQDDGRENTVLSIYNLLAFYISLVSLVSLDEEDTFPGTFRRTPSRPRGPDSTLELPRVYSNFINDCINISKVQFLGLALLLSYRVCKGRYWDCKRRF